MIKLSRILSYLYPVRIEITRSPVNPVLEVVLSMGKYALHSENTNYSHGTLHALFKKIFKKISLDWNDINDVLILGFGTGSIAEIINEYKKTCLITGVEIDSKIIELGFKYFYFQKLKNTEIICSPADEYVKTCIKKFDLVIIDVFIDIKVPDELETNEFMEQVKNSMKKNGLVIFNKVTYTREFKKQIPDLRSLYNNVFGNVELLTIMKTGKIFVSRKNDN